MRNGKKAAAKLGRKNKEVNEMWKNSLHNETKNNRTIADLGFSSTYNSWRLEWGGSAGMGEKNFRTKKSAMEFAHERNWIVRHGLGKPKN